MPPKKKKLKKEDIEEEVSDRPRSVKRRKDCPDCGSGNIIFDPETEQLICQDCGLIFEELPSDVEKKYNEVDEL